MEEYVINVCISYLLSQEKTPDVESVALEVEHFYPQMVDSVTTGMIKTRLQEVSDGQ